MSQGIIQTVGGAALIAAGVLVEIGTLGGGTPLAAALISAGAGMVLSGVGTMLSQGPLQGFATAVRNPVAPWEVVYGRKRVGGTIVFINSFGDNDKYLDLVMVLAAHPSQSVDALLFDQQRIQMVTTGPGKTSIPPTQQNVVIADIKRVGNVVTCKTVGDIPSLQPGDTVVIQQVPGDLTLNGKYPVANVIHGTGYVQFTYLCGGPASHVVSAGHVLTTWVDFGSKVYMEVMLGTQALGTTFSAMSTGTPNDGNIFDLVHNTANPWTANCSLVGKTAVWLRLHYNDKIFANGLPQISFLMHGKNDIYDPRTSPPSYGYTENAALCIADHLTNQAWGFKAQYGADLPIAPLIAAANVCDEAVDLAWPVTSPVTTEPRYACNGGFSLAMKRGDVLRNLLTSCAGRLTYYGGEYIIWPGAWYGVSGSITGTGLLSMATAAFRWRSTVSISNLYNGVKGTFISPANNWLSSDFPRYAQDATHGYSWGVGPTHDANLDADGGDRRWFDIQLPFTISASMAQRIAKIELLRRRNQGTGTFALNMAGYQFTPMDVIAMDLDFFGWTAKNLEVLDTRLKFDAQESGSQPVVLLGVEIDVQETDSSIYAWSASEELSPQGYQQASLPDTRTPSAPADFFGSSAGGTITIIWSAPSDAYVLNGGHVEVQYQLVASPEGLWLSMAKMEPTITTADIRGLRDGDQYNIRIRSVNAAGVPSDWVYAAPLGSSPPTPGPITVVGGIAGSEPLQISFPGTPGQVGVAYAVPLIASGGNLPYTFAIHAGSLPSGLSLDTATGIISGTPTTAGSSSFTARVTDSATTVVDLLCVIAVAMGSGAGVPVTLSSVTARDVGTASDTVLDPATRLVQMLVGVTGTWSATPIQQMGTIYLSKANGSGSSYYAIGWYSFSGSTEVQFATLRPLVSGTWKVALVAGTVDYNPSIGLDTTTLTGMGAKFSGSISVAAVPAPNETGATISLSVDAGTGSDANFPYDVEIGGQHYFSMPAIRLSKTGTFTNPWSYFARITARDYDASNNPIGPEQAFAGIGVSEFTGERVFNLIGAYGTDGGSYTRSADLAKVGFQVYLINETDQTDTSFTRPGAVLITSIGTAGLLLVTVAGAVVQGRRGPAGTFDHVDRTKTAGGTQYDSRGNLINNNDNFAAGVLQDPSFEFSTAGVLGSGGASPGWSWGTSIGSSIEIKNDGGNSGLNYARLIGPDAAMFQTIGVQPGLSLYLQVALRSSNTVGAHGVGIYVNWLDANHASLTPYTTIVGTVTGYVSSWTNNALSGFVTAPAGAAFAIIKIATSAGELGTWDIDDVLYQPTIAQTGNSQTVTTVPAAGSGDYSAISTSHSGDASSSYYGRTYAQLLAPNGVDTVAWFAVNGNAQVAASTSDSEAAVHALTHFAEMFAVSGLGASQYGIAFQASAGASFALLVTLAGTTYTGYTGTVQAAYAANKPVKNGIICT